MIANITPESVSSAARCCIASGNDVHVVGSSIFATLPVWGLIGSLTGLPPSLLGTDFQHVQFGSGFNSAGMNSATTRGSEGVGEAIIRVPPL